MTHVSSMCQRGKAAFIIGGQFGSEGKGAAAAYVGVKADTHGGFDWVTTNAGAQAGHTSIHDGKERVVFHLPTAPLVSRDWGKKTSVYLNAGSIIDPEVLEKELNQNTINYLVIHPNAAVITPECKEAEGRDDSAQTKVSSTRKGVGEALSRKVLRSGEVARSHPFLRQFVHEINLNRMLANGDRVLVEVPQGFGLSYNSRFYPYCTSRDCTTMQGLADARIHPRFIGDTMVVLRTYPIRVGNIGSHHSGTGYWDQRETSWEEIGVKAEITTVTKRVRRVFTWSRAQIMDAFSYLLPQHVFLTHCDYVNQETQRKIVRDICGVCSEIGIPRPKLYLTDGPSTDHVYEETHYE